MKVLDLDTEFMVQRLKLSLSGKSKECHTNARLVANTLKKRGFNVKVVRGFYINRPNKAIIHSWIECENKILETDPRQLRDGDCDLMPDEFSAVLNKDKIGHRYILEKVNEVEGSK